MDALSFRTSKKVELLDITDSVREVVGRSGVKEGLCLVFIPHSTAAIIINEWEPNLLRDVQKILERLVPRDEYEHNRIDDNAEAHLRNIALGCEKAIPIANGDLALGTWQRLILCELDGPRARKVFVTCR